MLYGGYKVVIQPQAQTLLWMSTYTNEPKGNWPLESHGITLGLGRNAFCSLGFPRHFCWMKSETLSTSTAEPMWLPPCWFTMNCKQLQLTSVNFFQRVGWQRPGKLIRGSTEQSFLRVSSHWTFSCTHQNCSMNQTNTVLGGQVRISFPTMSLLWNSSTLFSTQLWVLLLKAVVKYTSRSWALLVKEDIVLLLNQSQRTRPSSPTFNCWLAFSGLLKGNSLGTFQGMVHSEISSQYHRYHNLHATLYRLLW